MMDKLRATLEAHKEEYIRCLMDLAALDTQDLGHGIAGGREAAGQDYLAQLYTRMGAESVVKDQLTEEVIQESLRQHQEGNPGHNYDGRYNVYATFKGKGGPSLMFNGHVDTMPPGDESLWDTPPLTPTIRDGNLYGLGVCDMKGGLMAASMAVKLLQDAGIELPGDVVITSVVDEEGGGNGSIAAAMNGQKADAVVVCEPTDGQIIAAHMGFIFFKVEVEGRAVHSGSKWLGVSAIEKAVKIMAAIDEAEHKWLMNYKHPLLPAPTSNVGVIEGGTAGSTVADYCCFKTCVHYLPKVLSHEKMRRMYEDVIDRCCQGDEWLKDHRPRISIYQAGGAFEMELDHPFVDTVRQAVTEVTGRPAVVTGVPSGCDSRVWRSIAGCPTLQLGPGDPGWCHTVNEHIPLDSYLETILIYARMILDWGGSKQ